MKRFISFALIIVMMLGLVSCFEPIDPNPTMSTSKNEGSSTTTNSGGNGTTS